MTGERRITPDVWRRICNRVNPERYILGPATPGIFFSNGAASSSRGRSILRFEIPLAIRYAFKRVGYDNWQTYGCIGQPFGSLVVSLPAGRCDTGTYRELRYRGAAGDPPVGTPVKMFPDCEEMANVFDPTAGCRLAPQGSGTP